MIIGAHPDDPEGILGGMAMKFRAAGHRVLMLSMTDGSAGHHETTGVALAKRRALEAKNAAGILDVEYHIMPFKDGELVPSVENRNELIKVMRKFAPDLVFTHPMIDYHPDHRYTCQLVMDTSYMLNVPAVVPDSKIPAKHPAYFFAVTAQCDNALAFSIDDFWERKVTAWNCHESQMYEWLPWIDGYSDKIPKDRDQRIKWLSEHRAVRHMAIAGAFCSQLAADTRCAEAFASAPVGRQLTEDELKKIKEILTQ